MVIDERRMIVRLKRWLSERRQRLRQAHPGPAAARLPAPMARITVALPVTMSPPANTPLREVRWLEASAAM